MTTRRGMLLAELDTWHAEGALDDATWRFLRSRYENAADDPSLDTPLAPARGSPGADGTTRGAMRDTSAFEHDAEPRKSFAADAMQFIGGLLVGASLVALLIFLDIATGQQPLVLFGLGLVLFVPAALGAWFQWPRGLVEAGIGGAFVPWAVASGLSIDQSTWLIPLAVAAIAFATLFRPHGPPGPSTLVATGAYAFSSAAATFLQGDFLFGSASAESRWLWMGLLVAYGAVLLLRRHMFWNSFSLGLYVLPMALAFLSLLDLIPNLSSTGFELGLGAFFVALLAIGIPLGARGLVAGAAAGLTIDAVVFAFDLGGPGTTVVVLLGLGGLLVWQAEMIRRFFRSRPSRQVG